MRPCVLRVDGARIEVTQRSLPENTTWAKVEGKYRREQAEIKQLLLAVIDSMLWYRRGWFWKQARQRERQRKQSEGGGAAGAEDGEGERPVEGRGSPLLAQAIHSAVAFVLQRIVVHLQRVALLYVQPGPPGPEAGGRDKNGQPSKRQQCSYGVQLAVRHVVLQPAGRKMATGTALEAGAAGVEGEPVELDRQGEEEEDAFVADAPSSALRRSNWRERARLVLTLLRHGRYGRLCAPALAALGSGRAATHFKAAGISLTVQSTVPPADVPDGADAREPGAAMAEGASDSGRRSEPEWAWQEVVLQNWGFHATLASRPPSQMAPLPAFGEAQPKRRQREGRPSGALPELLGRVASCVLGSAPEALAAPAPLGLQAHDRTQSCPPIRKPDGALGGLEDALLPPPPPAGILRSAARRRGRGSGRGHGPPLEPLIESPSSNALVDGNGTASGIGAAASNSARCNGTGAAHAAAAERAEGKAKGMGLWGAAAAAAVAAWPWSWWGAGGKEQGEAAAEARGTEAASDPAQAAQAQQQAQQQCGVEVSVVLRAFMPRLSPPAVAVALGLAERLLRYSQYEHFWALRPQGGVLDSPVDWWQHAGRAVIHQCRGVCRRQVPLRQFAARRAARLQYQELYMALRQAGDVGWPGGRRRLGWTAGKARRLRQMEARLSLEEVAHFRAGAALQHGRLQGLAGVDGVARVMDAVSAMALNPAEWQLWTQHWSDRCSEHLAGHDVVRQALFSVSLKARLVCPKVGLFLHPAHADAPHASSPDSDPTEHLALEVCVCGLLLSLHSTECGGCFDATVQELLVTSAAAGEGDAAAGAADGRKGGVLVKSPCGVDPHSSQDVIDMLRLVGKAAAAAEHGQPAMFAAHRQRADGEAAGGKWPFFELQVLRHGGKECLLLPLLLPNEASPSDLRIRARAALVEVVPDAPLVWNLLRFSCAACDMHEALSGGPQLMQLMNSTSLAQAAGACLASAGHTLQPGLVSPFPQIMFEGAGVLLRIGQPQDCDPARPARGVAAGIPAWAREYRLVVGVQNITVARTNRESPVLLGIPIDTEVSISMDVMGLLEHYQLEDAQVAAAQPLAATMAEWLHPEDAPLISNRRRLTRGAVTLARYGKGRSLDVVPFMPVFKMGQLRLEAVHLTNARPSLSASLAVGLAVHSAGCIAWASPWHLQVLLAVAEAVEASCTKHQLHVPASFQPPQQEELALAPPSTVDVTGSLHLPLLTLLLFSVSEPGDLPGRGRTPRQRPGSVPPSPSAAGAGTTDGSEESSLATGTSLDSVAIATTSRAISSATTLRPAGTFRAPAARPTWRRMGSVSPVVDCSVSGMSVVLQKAGSQVTLGGTVQGVVVTELLQRSCPGPLQGLRPLEEVGISPEAGLTLGSSCRLVLRPTLVRTNALVPHNRSMTAIILDLQPRCTIASRWQSVCNRVTLRRRADLAAACVARSATASGTTGLCYGGRCRPSAARPKSCFFRDWEKLLVGRALSSGGRFACGSTLAAWPHMRLLCSYSSAAARPSDGLPPASDWERQRSLDGAGSAPDTMRLTMEIGHLTATPRVTMEGSLLRWTAQMHSAAAVAGVGAGAAQGPAAAAAPAVLPQRRSIRIVLSASSLSAMIMVRGQAMMRLTVVDSTLQGTISPTWSRRRVQRAELMQVDFQAEDIIIRDLLARHPAHTLVVQRLCQAWPEDTAPLADTQPIVRIRYQHCLSGLRRPELDVWVSRLQVLLLMRFVNDVLVMLDLVARDSGSGPANGACPEHAPAHPVPDADAELGELPLDIRAFMAHLMLVVPLSSHSTDAVVLQASTMQVAYPPHLVEEHILTGRPSLERTPAPDGVGPAPVADVDAGTRAAMLADALSLELERDAPPGQVVGLLMEEAEHIVQEHTARYRAKAREEAAPPAPAGAAPGGAAAMPTASQAAAGAPQEAAAGTEPRAQRRKAQKPGMPVFAGGGLRKVFAPLQPNRPFRAIREGLLVIKEDVPAPGKRAGAARAAPAPQAGPSRPAVQATERSAAAPAHPAMQRSGSVTEAAGSLVRTKSNATASVPPVLGCTAAAGEFAGPFVGLENQAAVFSMLLEELRVYSSSLQAVRPARLQNAACAARGASAGRRHARSWAGQELEHLLQSQKRPGPPAGNAAGAETSEQRSDSANVRPVPADRAAYWRKSRSRRASVGSSPSAIAPAGWKLSAKAVCLLEPFSMLVLLAADTEHGPTSAHLHIGPMIARLNPDSYWAMMDAVSVSLLEASTLESACSRASQGAEPGPLQPRGPPLAPKPGVWPVSEVSVRTSQLQIILEAEPTCWGCPRCDGSPSCQLHHGPGLRSHRAPAAGDGAAAEHNSGVPVWVPFLEFVMQGVELSDLYLTSGAAHCCITAEQVSAADLRLALWQLSRQDAGLRDALGIHAGASSSVQLLQPRKHLSPSSSWAGALVSKPAPTPAVPEHAPAATEPASNRDANGTPPAAAPPPSKSAAASDRHRSKSTRRLRRSRSSSHMLTLRKAQDEEEGEVAAQEAGGEEAEPAERDGEEGSEFNSMVVTASGHEMRLLHACGGRPAADAQWHRPLPVVVLCKGPVQLHKCEAAHLRAQSAASRSAFADGAKTLTILWSAEADTSMTTEVELSSCLIQWPWLSETGLSTALMSILDPASRRVSATEASSSGDTPWCQSKVLLKNTQVVVPVMESVWKLHEHITKPPSRNVRAPAKRRSGPSAGGPRSRKAPSHDSSSTSNGAGSSSGLARTHRLRRKTNSSIRIDWPTLLANTSSQAAAQSLTALADMGSQLQQWRPSNLPGSHMSWPDRGSGGARSRAPAAAGKLPRTSSGTSHHRGGSWGSQQQHPPIQRHQLFDIICAAILGWTRGQPPSSRSRTGRRVGSSAWLKSMISKPSAPVLPKLENRAVALVLSSLDFSYAYGGDGISIARLEAANVAGFVRSKEVQVRTILLPLSVSLLLEQHTPPPVSEDASLQEAALIIQRHWRRRMNSGAKHDGSGLMRDSSPPLSDNAPDGTDAATSQPTAAAQPTAMLQDSLDRDLAAVDDFIAQLAVGDRELEDMLLQQRHRSQPQQLAAAAATLEGRVPAEASLKLTVQELTIRSALSHAGILRDIIQIMEPVMDSMHPPPAKPAPVSDNGATPADGSDGAGKGAEEAVWQPLLARVEVDMGLASLVMCNDRPSAYGAPDVLQLMAQRISSCCYLHHRLPSNMPDGTLTLDTTLMCYFLNNETSRWETLVEPWPVAVEGTLALNPVSPHREEPQMFVGVRSEKDLLINFNPACLMTLGDVMAFMRKVQAPPPPVKLRRSLEAPGQPASPSKGSAVAAHLPSASEQMALQGSITSRVPQKYHIQNEAGVGIWYWTASSRSGRKGGAGSSGAVLAPELPARSCYLGPGQTGPLQVVPTTCQMSVLNNSTREVRQTRMASMIGLTFEGNWQPITDVMVDTVGKFRYRLRSPDGRLVLPVNLDVFLAGRTKIISIHSAVQLENRLDLDLFFRLHVPHSHVAAPVVMRAWHARQDSRRIRNSSIHETVSGSSSHTGATSVRVGGGNDSVASAAESHGVDTEVGPLRPGDAVYLPVTAVLDGSVHLRPEGYLETQRDVINLSPDLDTMQQQQGPVSCPPSDTQPLQGTASASVGAGASLTPAGTASTALQRAPSRGLSIEQQLLHNMSHLHCLLEVVLLDQGISSEFERRYGEVTGPCELVWASKPIECVLRVKPTVVLQNALPYTMDVLLLQLPPTGSLAQLQNEVRKHEQELKHRRLQRGSGQNRLSWRLAWSSRSIDTETLTPAAQQLERQPQSGRLPGSRDEPGLTSMSIHPPNGEEARTRLSAMSMPLHLGSGFLGGTGSWTSQERSGGSTDRESGFLGSEDEEREAEEEEGECAEEEGEEYDDDSVRSEAGTESCQVLLLRGRRGELEALPLRKLRRKGNTVGTPLNWPTHLLQLVTFISIEPGEKSHVYASRQNKLYVHALLPELTISSMVPEEMRWTRISTGAIHARTMTDGGSELMRKRLRKRQLLPETIQLSRPPQERAHKSLDGFQGSMQWRRSDATGTRRASLRLAGLAVTANHRLLIAGRPRFSSIRGAMRRTPSRRRGLLHPAAPAARGSEMVSKVSSRAASDVPAFDPVPEGEEGEEAMSASTEAQVPDVAAAEIQPAPDATDDQPGRPPIRQDLAGGQTTPETSPFARAMTDAYRSAVVFSTQRGAIERLPARPAEEQELMEAAFVPPVSQELPSAFDGLDMGPSEPTGAAVDAQLGMQELSGVDLDAQELLASPFADLPPLAAASSAGGGGGGGGGGDDSSSSCSDSSFKAGQQRLRWALQRWRLLNALKNRRASPSSTVLGLHNSLRNQKDPDVVCRITFFAPFWVFNRAGMDLHFPDSGGAQMKSMPHQMIGGTEEVAVPGGTWKLLTDLLGVLPQNVPVKPVLLNKTQQMRFRLCLASNGGPDAPQETRQAVCQGCVRPLVERKTQYSSRFSVRNNLTRTVQILGIAPPVTPRSFLAHTGRVLCCQPPDRQPWVVESKRPRPSSVAASCFPLGGKPATNPPSASQKGSDNVSMSHRGFMLQHNKLRGGSSSVASDMASPDSSPTLRHLPVPTALAPAAASLLQEATDGTLRQPLQPQTSCELGAGPSAPASAGAGTVSGLVSDSGLDSQGAPSLSTFSPFMAGGQRAGDPPSSGFAAPPPAAGQPAAAPRALPAKAATDTGPPAPRAKEKKPLTMKHVIATRRKLRKELRNVARPPEAFMKPSGRRLYMFSVEVDAGPPDTIFRRTKVVSIKNKFTMENDTGMELEVKQRYTPDPDQEYGAGERCCFRLGIGERAPLHWDDSDLPKELLIRPAGRDYLWSGGFKISDREDFVGLRVCHQSNDPTRHLILLASVRFLRDGARVRLRQASSTLPPYRLENLCKDVTFEVMQKQCLTPNYLRYIYPSDKRTLRHLRAVLEPGDQLAYSCDEPCMDRTLRVWASIRHKNRILSTEADIRIDEMGCKETMIISTSTQELLADGQGATAFGTQNVQQVPLELRARLTAKVAQDHVRKIFVSVLCDGPTRVLQLSDVMQEKIRMNSCVWLEDTCHHIQVLERRLKEVDQGFARARGQTMERPLDVFGRSRLNGLFSELPSTSELSRASSTPQPSAAARDAAAAASRTAALQATRGGRFGRTGSMEIPATIPESQPSQDRSNGGSPTASGPAAKAAGAGSNGMEDMPASLQMVWAVVAGEEAGAAGAAPQPAGPSRAQQGGAAARSGCSGSASSSPRAAEGARHGARFSPGALLMLGGDLVVKVHNVSNIHGDRRSTHPFVRIRIEETTQQTSIQWSTLNPVFNERLHFPKVRAASEMVLEVYDLGDTRGYAELEKLINETNMIAKSRFIGGLRLPLAPTFRAAPGQQLAHGKVWKFPLTRRAGADSISGVVFLSLQWDVTVPVLLSLKARALEGLISQRQEVQAILHTVQPMEALRWQHQMPASPSRLRYRWTAGVPGQLQSESQQADSLSANKLRDMHTMKMFVSVMEVRNVRPRRGIKSALGVMTATEVEVSLGEQSISWKACSPCANPSFEEARREAYSPMSLNDRLQIKLLSNNALLGEAQVLCRNLPLSGPVHAWIPLIPPREAARQAAALAASGSEAQGRDVRQPAGSQHAAAVKVLGRRRLQVQQGMDAAGKAAAAKVELYPRVRMRIEVVPSEIRGRSLLVDLHMAGCALTVLNGVQEELFNLSIQSISQELSVTQESLRLSGAIEKVQLDNQRLDAIQPVVLAPAGIASVISRGGSSRSGDGQRRHRRSNAADKTVGGWKRTSRPGSREKMNMPQPLMRYNIVHSFVQGGLGLGGGGDDRGYSGSAAEPAALGSLGPQVSHGVGPAPGRNRLLADGPAPRSTASGGDLEMSTRGDSLAGAAGGKSLALGRRFAQDIMSFKEISLEVGPTDVMTDESFLRNIFAFLMSLPLADLVQDDEYLGLLDHVSPLEAAPAPYSAEELLSDCMQDDPLCWVQERYREELRAMRGMSQSATWLFVESLYISPITSNVTITLTSNILTASHIGRHKRHEGSSLFKRALGSSGFELINVQNVPLQLGRFTMSNRLISTSSMTSTISRHYITQGLLEIHKVLGGTGPAIAQVPGSLIWGVGSFVDIGRDLASRRLNALSLPSRMGFVTFMTIGQVIGVFSRTLAAVLAAVPPHRQKDMLSDASTVQRYIRRPQNAIEAFKRAAEELVLSLVGAASGLVIDPVMGATLGQERGLLLGIAKGSVGAVLRPAAGAIECISKSSVGAALLCLGPPGIQGHLMRRVRPPGAVINGSLPAAAAAPPPTAPAPMEEAGGVAGGEGAAAATMGHDGDYLTGTSFGGLESNSPLVALWQEAMPALHCAFADDIVEHVILPRRRRTLVITHRHVVLFRSYAGMQDNTVYRMRWYIPMQEISSIQADSDRKRIIVFHALRVRLGIVGSFRLPAKKVIKVTSRELYQRMVMELMRTIGTPSNMASSDAASNPIQMSLVMKS